MRVLYNGTPLDLPCSAEGEQLCRLADFKAMVAKYCVECYESECAERGGAAAASSTGAGAQAAKRY